MLPGMIVINPCDFNQTKAATKAISKVNGPVYLRFGRKGSWILHQIQLIEIGKGIKLIEGNDVTIIATGHLVEALEAEKDCRN